MTIADCITFTVTQLVSFLSSAPVFPFVGIWVAAFIIYIIFSILYRR